MQLTFWGVSEGLAMIPYLYMYTVYRKIAMLWSTGPAYLCLPWGQISISFSVKVTKSFRYTLSNSLRVCHTLNEHYCDCLCM